MRTYITEIIPKLLRFSKRLDDLTLITNQHWVSLSDIHLNKVVYIFRPNNQLLISENGLVNKSVWELLNNESLLLERNDETYLFKKGFIDENVMALRIDGSDNFAFFINETKYDNDLNNINDVLDFLTKKYLHDQPLLKQTTPEVLYLSKLSKPNFYIKRFLKYGDAELVNSLNNWQQNCVKHSTEFPIYVYYELKKRGILIPKDTLADLEYYARWKKFNSFDDIIKYYRD